MNLHQRLHRPRLIVLLHQWLSEAAERAGVPAGAAGAPGLAGAATDVVQSLSEWLGTVDAVRLSRALPPMEAAVALAAQPVSRCDQPLGGAGLDWVVLQQGVDKAQADIGALVSRKNAPARPLRARADNTPVLAPDPQDDAQFSAHGPRYAEIQRQMDGLCQALRRQARNTLAQGPQPLAQLAALDAVWEQMLDAREQKLWQVLPGFLERRFGYRRQRHEALLRHSGVTDDPQRWQQVGGWLWAFEQDFQALVQAEMQMRLQPVMGLLQAAQGPMNVNHRTA